MASSQQVLYDFMSDIQCATHQKGDIRSDKVWQKEKQAVQIEMAKANIQFLTFFKALKYKMKTQN